MTQSCAACLNRIATRIIAPAPRRCVRKRRRTRLPTAAPDLRLMRAAALALVLLLCAPATAQDAPRVALRAGSHADHGRLVFDWPAPVPYTAETRDGQLVLRFDAPGRIDLQAARRLPRNVLAVEQADGAIVVQVAAGARIRDFRLGNRIVVDVLDAPPARAEARAPRAAPPAAAPPQAKSADAPAPDNAAPAYVLPASAPAPAQAAIHAPAEALGPPASPAGHTPIPVPRLCTARFVADDPLPLDRFFVGLLTGDGCAAGDVLHFTFATDTLAAAVAARHCRFDGPVLLNRGEQTHLVCVWLGTMRTGR